MSRSAAKQRRDRLVIGIGRVAVGVVFLLLWEFSPELFGLNPLWLSRPSIVWEKAVETIRDGTLLPHVLTTLSETFLGLILGSVVGILIGIFVGRSVAARAVVEPFLLVANAFPKVALAPLFLVWFGLGIAMKVAVAFSLVVVVMALTTISGIRTVRPELVNSAKLMGASDRKIFTSIVLPSIAPWLFSGLKVSLAFALIGAILGEFIAAQQGIGALIDEGFGNFDSGAVYLGLTILLAISWIINSGTDVVAQRWGYMSGLGEQYRS
jgi:NitT/TauT family transport system permease protein